MVRRSGNVSDKSVTLKWGEDGTRMQNTEPEVIFVDMEEEERRTTFSFMKEEPTENEDLEYSIKLSLSQELNRLIELFKVKYQEKDSKIELLLDKENINEAEIEALQFQLEQASIQEDTQCWQQAKHISNTPPLPVMSKTSRAGSR